VVQAFDLSPSGRSAPTVVKGFDLDIKPGQAVVLQLPDGTTLTTGGACLESELRRVTPDSVGSGTVDLDRLRAPGSLIRRMRGARDTRSITSAISATPPRTMR